jgi:hypothetical protein
MIAARSDLAKISLKDDSLSTFRIQILCAVDAGRRGRGIAGIARAMFEDKMFEENLRLEETFGIVSGTNLSSMRANEKGGYHKQRTPVLEKECYYFILTRKDWENKKDAASPAAALIDRVRQNARGA